MKLMPLNSLKHLIYPFGHSVVRGALSRVLAAFTTLSLNLCLTCSGSVLVAIHLVPFK